MMPSSDSSFACMYQSSFVKDFPKGNFGASQGMYPDTLKAIDAQRSSDVKGLRREMTYKRF